MNQEVMASSRVAYTNIKEVPWVNEMIKLATIIDDHFTDENRYMVIGADMSDDVSDGTAPLRILGMMSSVASIKSILTFGTHLLRSNGGWCDRVTVIMSSVDGPNDVWIISEIEDDNVV